MATNQPFTPAALDNLKKGKLPDPLTPGLFVIAASRSGKIWKYRRRIAGTTAILKASLGTYPAHSIAVARAWARAFNDKVEIGIDPREEKRAAAERASMTVARAHGLYMDAVRDGRASRAKRKNKPRTIADKQEIYDRDIAAKLGKRSVYDVCERDLIDLVIRKGKTAKVRANRLIAELKIFFGWAAGLRGLEVGLETDPSRRLGDLRYPESPRQRKLSLDEIAWFLKAVAEEPRDFRRGMLLWLLAAARISEVIFARRDDVVLGVWTIPADIAKNRSAHSIALGPWGQRLMATNSEWVFPAERVKGPRKSGWYKARDRVLKRMSEYAGREIEHFNPHDFRRTARSNTKRLRTDYETAEAMLNHLRTGLERIYDGYELEDEKAEWFLKWENEIIRIAREINIADALDVPKEVVKPKRTRRRMSV